MTERPLPRSRVVFFVTGNINKFKEAHQVLAESGIATALLKMKPREIQDDNIERVARDSAIKAAKAWDLPIIVEDAGLFIDALNGFPGPYSSYAYRTIGNLGILKLMKNVENREALFHSVVAFCNSSGSPMCFHGEIKGRISQKERGSRGFGFDPIFEPSGGLGRTFSEFTTKEKNRYSHRARAFQSFALWYVKQ